MGLLEDFMNAHIDAAVEAVEHAIETPIRELTDQDDEDKDDD